MAHWDISEINLQQLKRNVDAKIKFDNVEAISEDEDDGHNKGIQALPAAQRNAKNMSIHKRFHSAGPDKNEHGCHTTFNCASDTVTKEIAEAVDDAGDFSDYEGVSATDVGPSGAQSQMHVQLKIRSIASMKNEPLRALREAVVDFSSDSECDALFDAACASQSIQPGDGLAKRLNSRRCKGGPEITLRDSLNKIDVDDPLGSLKKLRPPVKGGLIASLSAMLSRQTSDFALTRHELATATNRNFDTLYTVRVVKLSKLTQCSLATCITVNGVADDPGLVTCVFPNYFPLSLGDNLHVINPTFLVAGTLWCRYIGIANKNDLALPLDLSTGCPARCDITYGDPLHCEPRHLLGSAVSVFAAIDNTDDRTSRLQVLAY